MNHDVAVQQNATERYLLNELDSEERNEFEEHFFGCRDCARDVSAGFKFIEHGKDVCFEPDPVPDPKPWFAWLRPAYAVPAFALLLAVIGYQNLVMIPQMGQAIHKAQVLPATFVHLNTYSDETNPASSVSVRPGQEFVIQIPVPSDHRFSSYKGELHNPSGNVESSLSMPVSTAETWEIKVPGGIWQDGVYTFVLYGVTEGKKDEKIGTGSIGLNVKK